MDEQKPITDAIAAADASSTPRITYHDQKDIENTLKLREVLKSLPPFVKDYFRAAEATTSTRTRLSYAYDLKVFFQFLIDENPAFKNYAVKDFKVTVLDELQAVDIEEYLEYLKVYSSGDKTLTNRDRSIKRKLASLSSFYTF